MNRLAAVALVVALAFAAVAAFPSRPVPVGWHFDRAVSLLPEEDQHVLTGRETWVLPFRFAPSGESAVLQVLPAGVHTNAALGAVFDCTAGACADFARRSRHSGLARRPCIIDLDHASCRDPGAPFYGIVTNIWSDVQGVWAVAALNAEGAALLRTGGVFRASAAMRSSDVQSGPWRIVLPWSLKSLALTASPVLPTAPVEMLP